MNFERKLDTSDESFPEGELGKRNEKGLWRKKIEKALRAFMAAHILVFGAACSTLTGLKTPEQHIEYLEQTEPLGQSEKEKAKEELAYLRSQLYGFGISFLEKADKYAERAKKEHPKRPAVVGFERAGLDSESLRDVWDEPFYPKKWVRGNVSEVAIPKTDSKNWDLRAQTQMFSGRIDFFMPPDFDRDPRVRRTYRESLGLVFSHELCHKNDWVNATYLNPKERAHFLFEVMKQFKALGSFRSADILRIKSISPAVEEYTKVAEYWAHICSYYFSTPVELKKEFPGDFELVDRRVKQIDPEYNTFIQSEARQKIMTKITGEKNE